MSHARQKDTMKVIQEMIKACESCMSQVTLPQYYRAAGYVLVKLLMI